MDFLSRIGTRAVSWYQATRRPTAEMHTTSISQSWHEFDEASQRWRPRKPSRPTTDHLATQQEPQSLNLVTWNVDYSSPQPGPRLTALISRVLGLSPPVDIIFLQEVAGEALSVAVDEPRLRQDWLLSDIDKNFSGSHRFTTISLLSKSWVRHAEESLGREPLGPIWRLKYPSHFERDALCCDIFVPSSSASSPARIRLVNVHLDSLPIRPSFRPQQISILAELLRSPGRGVVAGDFNPVLPEDETLVEDNGFVDAWVELRPGESGFTWGIDGKQPFPPNRLDKVALLGLKVQDVEILHPGYLAKPIATVSESEQKQITDEPVPWSDHSGLRCSFRLVEPHSEAQLSTK